MTMVLTASDVNDCGLSSLYVRTLSHSPLRPLSQSAEALSPIWTLTGTCHVCKFYTELFTGTQAVSKSL